MVYLLLILAAAAAVWYFWKQKKEKKALEEETDTLTPPPVIKPGPAVPAKPEEPVFETERIYKYYRPPGGWDCPLCGGRNSDSDPYCRICLGKKTG